MVDVAKLTIDVVSGFTTSVTTMPGIEIGIPGPQGPPGTGGGGGGGDGEPGAPGSRWYSGTGAPSTSLGLIGDWYLRDTNGDVYEKTGATTWTVRDNLTGPTGAAGAAGTPGSKWSNANGTPSAATPGAVGDWYLNSANGEVFEKVTSTTWTLRAIIRGPAGSKWYSGAGTPSTSLGVVGDWYLNDVDGAVHEKTGASSWTLRDNLTGPAGPQGPQGIQGIQGNPGTGGGGITDLPDSVSHDVWQAAGGAWPVAAPPEIPSGARINWISQPGDTTAPPAFRTGQDSYTHRTL